MDVLDENLIARPKDLLDMEELEKIIAIKKQ